MKIPSDAYDANFIQMIRAIKLYFIKRIMHCNIIDENHLVW